ncbi:MAG TPA: hypothetical protein PLP27_02305 [Crocinitomicaceae bacterium]|nr:hypothetical protein [Crocinitomicaceae bacterium]
MKSFLILLPLLILAACGLRYTPTATPETTQSDRKKLIEETIAKEFQRQNKIYKPIGYAESVKIKPVSYIKLDSLFEVKYRLERAGKRDANLDESIKMQQIVCKNDTNEILYLERHVFSLESDTSAEILSGDFYIDKQNELKDLKFTESYHIDKNYINYYSMFIFEQPFLGGDYLTTEEQNFYKIYKQELQNRTNKDDFLNNTLKIMQIAYYKRSLDMQTLLKELTRKVVHNDKTNYSDEVFIKMEQIKDGDVLQKYSVLYQSMTKTADNIYTKRYNLEFDPFLMLLSKEEVLF